MSTREKIDVIVVNFNSTKYLINLIRSLKKIDKIINKLIIIDNNSNDFKNFESSKKTLIIKNNKNYGFAKAVNQGIKKSKSDFILLLNPDTEIIDNSIIKLFQKIRNNKKIGAIGGKIINFKKNKKLMTANSIPTFLTGLFEFTNLKKIFPNNKFTNKFWIEKNKKIKLPIEVASLCGAFLMFRKIISKKKIYFNENYFLYLEDLDFCLRLRNKKYKVIFDPNSSIKHIGGGSNESKYHIVLKHWYKSRKIFFLQNINFILGCILYIVFSIEEISLYFYHIFKNTPND